jgi:hypothetical protein
LARNEAISGKAAVLHFLAEHQRHGAAQLVVEDPQRLILKVKGGVLGEVV